jgi:hypothetical protein
VDRIRAFDDAYRAVLEERHGADLKAVFAGKAALPTIPHHPHLPHLLVAVVPVAPPRPDYTQCVHETPEKGTRTPIS